MQGKYVQLVSFRIYNFRSIADSGWIPFSPDGITVLVGQNESGKSSVLEALHAALANSPISTDDFRIGAPLPSVQLRISLNISNIKNDFSLLSDLQRSALKIHLLEDKQILELEIRWGYELSDGKKSLTGFPSLINDFTAALEVARKIPSGVVAGPAPSVIETTSDEEPSETKSTDESEVDKIAEGIWSALPLGVLFNEESGRLPSQVDINEKGRPTGAGALAAQSFLQIAEIDLPQLLQSDRRARENILNKANTRVSADFNDFWSQTIGKSGRLSLKCEIDHYSSDVPEKSGKPHIVFWINDGTTQLYPKQRSQGVRWFVSFYLQLKASEKSKSRRVFLLDEPGANLHSKAQGDVLKLINKLGKETSSVVYSTHSPQMIEYPKLFRVLAVQRSGDLDDSPTQIIDAHRLGTASTDTLSPILNAMGVDLSHQNVIRKKNNVLLEEMSGYYYISAFWKLASSTKEAYFLATTGVNKIEAFANMFIGWGLDFIIAVDDDKQGREAFNSMKRELFGGDEVEANKYMLKLPECPTIEDAFSTDDFSKFILKNESVKIPGTNADYIKSKQISKPMLAFGFARDVSDGKLTLDLLTPDSQRKIKGIVTAIEERLK